MRCSFVADDDPKLREYLHRIYEDDRDDDAIGGNDNELKRFTI